ncbi:YbfB/YjiJ family MFS transporter, partial [Zoogloea sp.]|uniref:YbfB/YjiJ family MFS transporter n=1 Tax=Zoogloea sp. TaxID=49181 RepID=UPI00141641C9
STGVALEVAERGTALQGWWILGALAALAALVAGTGLLSVEAPHVPAPPSARGPVPASPPRPLGWLAAAYGLAGFGYIVNATFLPVILRSQAGTAEAALHGWLLVGLAALPATALWVRLSFRWSVYSALLAATLLQAVGVALPVLVEGSGAALAGAVLLGGTFMGIAGLAQWLARVPDPHATARRIGLITACYGLGQIAGPLLVAWWGRDGGFRLPVLAAAGALLLSAVLLEVSRRRERLA